MKLLDRIKSALGMHHAVPTEDDVPPDGGTAVSRATGGADTSSGDSAGTTGTGSSDTFVGRVAGEDAGAAGETGAEARRESPDDHG